MKRSFSSDCIQHTHSDDFSIGQSIFDNILLIWCDDAPSNLFPFSLRPFSEHALQMNLQFMKWKKKTSLGLVLVSMEDYVLAKLRVLKKVADQKVSRIFTDTHIVYTFM